MQLQLAEIILLAMWSLAGFFVALGCITNHPKLQCHSLFGIENRWGKLCIGLVLLTYVIIRVTQWCTSANPTVNWSL